MSCYYLLYGITIHTVHVIYRRQDTGTYDSYDFWKRSKFLLSISTSHVKMLCSTWNSMRLLAHQASAPLCSTSNFFSLFVPTTQFLERRHIAWGSDSCPFLVTKMIILVVMLQLTKVEINALLPLSPPSLHPFFVKTSTAWLSLFCGSATVIAIDAFLP